MKFKILNFFFFHLLLCVELNLSELIKQKSVKLGLLLRNEQKGGALDTSFVTAIQHINKNPNLLQHTKLEYNLQYVNHNSALSTIRKVCSQIESCIQAYFAQDSFQIGTYIESVCNLFDIPLMDTRISIKKSSKMGINLYPTLNLFNKALLELINFLGWIKISVIYDESNEGNLQKLDSVINNGSFNIDLKLLRNNNYKKILNDIKKSHISNIIVNISNGSIKDLLKSIIEMDMGRYSYNFLFISFDLQTKLYEDLRFNMFNITAIRLYDPDDINIKKIKNEMHHVGIELRKENQYRHGKAISHQSYKNNKKNSSSELRDHHSSPTFNTESSLMYDSVFTFAYGLHAYEQNHELKKENLSCSDEQPWNEGATLFNYINAVDCKGITGPIKFYGGSRIEFNLEIIKLINNEIVKVGEWTPRIGLHINKTAMWKNNLYSGANDTLSVVSILEKPFIMMRYGKNYTGNERFYGFCVDLLDRIANDVGFDYILDLVPDRKYGAKDPFSGEWNGMVSQLIKHKADLAVGPMTINYARESVIDFTEPFMNLGIGLLYKKPELQQTRSFSFMIPFKKNIWISSIIVYILASLTMYVITLISPYEFGCHRLSLKNCFWLSIVILMQQDSNINPTAPSTRIAVSSWMYFSLVMISSYTANLAAFFTVERMTTPIKNINDLADQTEIAYGTLESGSTMSFFRDSTIEQHKKMWRFMDNKRPSVFPSTYYEGINRVLKGNYAFLMESTMIDYTIQRNCNLTQIGGLIDSKNYGIATQFSSPWRDKISLAILELREKGELQMLYDKWWKITNGECLRSDKTEQLKANALGVDSIGGIFLVLGIGISIASLVSLYEFYIADKHHYAEELIPKSAKTSQRQSIYSKMHREFCSAIRCTDSSRRTALRRRCPDCELLTFFAGNNGNINAIENAQHETEINDFITALPPLN